MWARCRAALRSRPLFGRLGNPPPGGRRARNSGIMEGRAGFSAFHPVSIADGSPKLATARALHSGSGSGASWCRVCNCPAGVGSPRCCSTHCPAGCEAWPGGVPRRNLLSRANRPHHPSPHPPESQGGAVSLPPTVSHRVILGNSAFCRGGCRLSCGLLVHLRLPEAWLYRLKARCWCGEVCTPRSAGCGVDDRNETGTACDLVSSDCV